MFRASGAVPWLPLAEGTCYSGLDAKSVAIVRSAAR